MIKGNGIKVIVSMIGLDSHTTGAEVVATLLRDAGFEVVYLGVNQSPAMIVNAAIQEDVDVIGISSHASNFALIEELMELVEENGLIDVPVVCGGNIPPNKIEHLTAKGVAKVFPPGSSGEAIVDYLATGGRRLNADQRRAK
ncbi:MAG: cobalamin-dependent protein [Rhodospirillales bacterium]|jgi:methylmalonyl-CoA mutase C-terminal domain/subunit|nr:methylmalonyl-CoA mutase [Rhodospirillaceae bacterium]MDP6430193.1 cobalamin-dependent protein [Rhodospirillales bacterium]MDP6644176.1 cobalamin-dependent protein [Rhodospirillales bacterium]MDP6840101.1 cobalamin-dependent protein [Rhodospirillales bacterium]|tara:strand:+ start:601 stop:1026 length:426 start_codon:yes stop_codon:yes gene_type:complete